DGGRPAVVVSTLEVLHGRDLPDAVLARVVALFDHEDKEVVRAALAVLADRPVPVPLISQGVSRLLAPRNADGGLLTQFLHGRGMMSGEAAAAVYAWISEDPLARWLIAGELEWPEQFARELALRVRALAAARAVADTNAFGGLVADAAARWLAGATDLEWP